MNKELWLIGSTFVDAGCFEVESLGLWLSLGRAPGFIKDGMDGRKAVDGRVNISPPFITFPEDRRALVRPMQLMTHTHTHTHTLVVHKTLVG